MADFAEFTTVPIPIRARRLFVDGWYDISGKPKLCGAGTWIVQAVGGTGAQLNVPDDLFRQSYRPSDTKSEAMWLEQTNKVHPIWPTKDASPIKLH
jgi:hypothetical protein